MSDLARHLSELAGTEELLVALDFDGTLAPLVDDPEESRALPEALAAIDSLLAAPHTSVALISGRALESLLRVAEVPESTLIVASHGVESRLGGTAAVTLSAAEATRRDDLLDVLTRVAARFPGVWVEAKPAGFALHTRLATPDDGRGAVDAAVAATSALDGLTVRRGTEVIEFSVRSDTKGDGIRGLRQFTGATAVFFAGDDVTDEDAFAALEPHDLGLKCGRGETLAGHSVDTPDEVAAVLRKLARLRHPESAA